MSEISTISFSKPVDVKHEAVKARKKRYRDKKKAADHKARAEKVKKALTKDLSKPLAGGERSRVRNPGREEETPKTSLPFPSPLQFSQFSPSSL